MGNVT